MPTTWTEKFLNPDIVWQDSKGQKIQKTKKRGKRAGFKGVKFIFIDDLQYALNLYTMNLV